jgi:excisionase family DNA binding protein
MIDHQLIEQFKLYRAHVEDPAAAAILVLVDNMKAVPRVKDDKDVYSVSEASEYLKVTPTTVYTLCKEGRLKHHRIGKGRGTIRIKKRNLENLTRG